MYRSAAILVALLATALLPVVAHAQSDGARAYQIIPNHTQVLNLYGIFLRGNQTADPGSVIKGGDIDVNLGVLQYTGALAVAGHQAGLFAVLPFGEVSGQLKPPFSNVAGSSSGIGDLMIGAVLNLIGPPPLSPSEFAEYPPGFTLGLLAKLVTPTGEYDADKVLNVGANRWSLQLGAPMAWYVGGSFLDPGLATIELVPSVAFFTANDDPFGARTTGQHPLYRLEGHVTRNLHRAVWVSLDALYVYGGETITDGRDDDNTQRAFELGGTVNVSFSAQASVKVSYGEVVTRNDDGPDGRMLRLIGALVF